ncbi:hypothetical protein CANCADRAFT_25037, partial [Tortispora caseinolytica NRRL Y-17796]
MSGIIENRLFVRPLTRSTTQSTIEDLFGPYGPITEVRVFPTFCFVELESGAKATEAINALDGTSFEGETLQVTNAK